MPIPGRGLLTVKRENFWTNIGTVNVKQVGFDATTTLGDGGVPSRLVLPPHDGAAAGLLYAPNDKKEELRVSPKNGIEQCLFILKICHRFGKFLLHSISDEIRQSG